MSGPAQNPDDVRMIGCVAKDASYDFWLDLEPKAKSQGNCKYDS